MNLTWEPHNDALLVNPYRPLPQLISSKLASQDVQQALTQGHTAWFKVEEERFKVAVATIQSKPRSLPKVPDLEIQVQQKDSGIFVATLTADSRKRLQAIADGVATVSANIGITKLKKFSDRSESKLAPATKRSELAQKYQVTEEVIQNWCSMCSLRSSLTSFSPDQLERLELYRRLSDAGVRASDVRLIFKHWQ